ncbi:MAG: NAD-dependent epimerase/dehydratase family protein, partial [Candidatus Binatia bacterium]
RDATINVLGLIRVLEACVATGAGKVVFASSGGAMYGPQEGFPVTEDAVGRPAAPYGITKRCAEDYLRYYREQYELDFTSLALANVYGPRQDPYGEAGVIAIFAAKLVRGEAPTINGTGEDTRDYVFVDDVADAFVRAADRASGETVNVGTGRETSVNKLFQVMAGAAGFTGQPIYGPPRAGDLPRNVLDPSKAKRVLEWKPWTKLADGIAQTVDWFARGAR